MEEVRDPQVTLKIGFITMRNKLKSHLKIDGCFDLMVVRLRHGFCRVNFDLETEKGY